jgi:hypothetical protein
MVSKPKRGRSVKRKRLPQPTEPVTMGPIAEYHERKIAEARGAAGKNRGGAPPVADVDRAPVGKNLGGRPFLPDEVRRGKRVYVLTTDSEYGELQGAATHVGMSVSTWIRFVALERARALAAEKEAARKRDE